MAQAMTRLRPPALVLLVAALGACRGEGASPKAADVATTAADAGTNASDAPASMEGRIPLRPVMQDPRMTAAAELEQQKKYADAAKALAAARAGLPAGALEPCAVDYAIGRLAALGGDDALAAQAFDAASAPTDAGGACALHDYAALHAAEAFERRGDPASALARLAAVDGSIALADDANLLRAEALGATGKTADAMAAWRAFLAKKVKGPRWIDTSTRLAKFLLAPPGGGTPTRADAKEAFELVTRVVVEAPSVEESTGAVTLRKQARALDPTLPEPLTDDERARRAQAWLDGLHADKAKIEADALLAAIKGPSDAACAVATTRAQAIAKLKGSVADAWDEAIARCDGRADAHAAALYSAAKALAGKKPDEAIDRYGRVEKEHPKHRLADDARHQAALLVLAKGDEAKAEALWTTLSTDYPEGDMRGEATFRAALLHVKRGDWAGAKPLLDAGAAIDGDAHHWAIAGRAAYFRARAAEALGDLADAKARYADLIHRFPLAFYMALAHARLEALEPGAGAAAIAKAEADDTAALAAATPPAAPDGPALRRAIGLLEVAELDAAKKELALAGLLGDGVASDLVWIGADLLDRAGAPELGSALTRQRITDHLAHYPVGSARVRWETAYPRAFAPLVTAEAKARAVAAPLLWAIMREESGFYPEIRSGSNAIGLMQLLPSTAREVAKGTNIDSDEAALRTPAPNVALGTKLLASLRQTFSANPALAIPAYNAGPGAVRGWLAARGTERFDVFVELIPYEETRGYVKRVLGSELAYAYLYDRSALPELLHLPARADGQTP
jgi:soluble lytic murein transglycosylase